MQTSDKVTCMTDMTRKFACFWHSVHHVNSEITVTQPLAYDGRINSMRTKSFLPIKLLKMHVNRRINGSHALILNTINR